jgi:hypothetical protein
MLAGRCEAWSLALEGRRGKAQGERTREPWDGVGDRAARRATHGTPGAAPGFTLFTLGFTTTPFQGYD